MVTKTATPRKTNKIGKFLPETFFANNKAPTERISKSIGPNWFLKTEGTPRLFSPIFFANQSTGIIKVFIGQMYPQKNRPKKTAPTTVAPNNANHTFIFPMRINPKNKIKNAIRIKVVMVFFIFFSPAIYLISGYPYNKIIGVTYVTQGGNVLYNPTRDDHPLLNTIPEEFYKAFLNRGEILQRTFQREQILHFEEEICAGLEIVLSGEIHIERMDENGYVLIVSRFLPGDILGGNLLFSRVPTYPMLVQAKELSRVLYLPKQTVLKLCLSNSDFLIKFLEGISDNALLLGNTIRNHIQIPLRQSLLHFLEKEARLQGSNVIVLPYSKKVLADFFGVARTSLHRVLQQLKKEELLDFDRKTITLLRLKKRRTS